MKSISFEHFGLNLPLYINELCMLLSAYIVFMTFSKLIFNTLLVQTGRKYMPLPNAVAIDNVAPFYFQRSNTMLKALKIVFNMKPVSHLK